MHIIIVPLYLPEHQVILIMVISDELQEVNRTDA